MITLDEFFADRDESRQLFDAMHEAIEDLGEVELRVTKSQVAFRTSQGKAFARAWMPGQYLRGKTAPLVLTLSLRSRHPSPRWKEIVEPAPGRFTHHLELYAVDDIDQEVRGWLRDAWQAAGLERRRPP